MNVKYVAVGCFIIGVLLTVAYGPTIMDLVNPPIPPVIDDTIPVVPVGTKYSKFAILAVEKDKTATAVTGATVRIWWDANNDGGMQYSELSQVTESSGTYTSNLEFPIGDFPIWLQLYSATHEVTYKKIRMTGEPSLIGTAKTLPNLEVIATDDAITWNGMTSDGVAFDTTDFNATLYDLTPTVTFNAILAAEDDGITSCLWKGINYETVYGIDKEYPYFIKWDTINEGLNDELSIYADAILTGTFYAMYCTEQDFIDGKIALGDFDLYVFDGTNYYFINFLDGIHDVNNDWFYGADDTALAEVPNPSFTFHMGSTADIAAAGTFLATYGVGLWHNVPYGDMLVGGWTKGTTLALGTCGDGFAWVV